MVTEPLIYIFKRRDSTDNAIVSDLANGKRIRLYQIFDHIVLAAIQYSLGRHTYMPGIVAEFTCRNLSCLDEATRFTAVAEIRAHLTR